MLESLYLTKKWSLSEGVLSKRFSTFWTKTHFPENQKSWPKAQWKLACDTGSEFHKHPRMCERGEWRKQLRDFITQRLKQTHLGSGTFSRLFWSNGITFKLAKNDHLSPTVCVALFVWLMIAFITCKSSLVPLLEGLCTSNPCRFEFSVIWVFAET